MDFDIYQYTKDDMDDVAEKRDTCFIRHIKRLSQKQIRYSSHLEFLRKCLEEEIVPKGFELSWKLTFDTTEDRRRQIHDILRDSSFDLIRKSIEVCVDTLQNIDEKLKQFKMNKNDSEDEQEINQLNNNIRKFRQKMENSKNHKLQVLREKTESSNGGIVSEKQNQTSVDKVKITGDGNCFFRAMSFHLFDTETEHLKIRKEVTEELKNNRDFYREYVDGDFSTHIINISKSDGSFESWAHESEIIAAAYKYNLDVFIKKNFNGTTEFWKYPVDDECDHRKEYVVLENNNDHFEILLYRNRPCACSNTDSQDNYENIVSNNSELNLEPQPLIPDTEEIKENRNEIIVTNLSSKCLSEAQKSLLSKGLKFVPTRKRVELGKLISDLKSWERRMRLREYFFDKNNSNSHEYNNKFKAEKKRKSFTPLPGRDKWMDLYIQNVKDDIIQGLRKNSKMNITKEEENAMREILNDNTIVIRPADKGSGIVVMDADKYTDNLEQEVKDSDTYEEVDTDLTQKIRNKVKKLVNEMHKSGSITDELRKYMLPFDSGAGKLQANPKLHKKNIPVRTIVNGRNHPTAKMAEVVEDQLKENVQSLYGFVKDTTDFLNKLAQIETPLDRNTIMFCMDAKALYPSVPRAEARNAAEAALNQRSNQDIPTDDVLKMMDLVLENNNFSFKGRHFIQKEGTAIGSHLGMNYASTYMGEWEKELFRRSPYLPIAYFRYVDDIFGLWSNGMEELNKFHEIANSIHPRIKVDLRHSSEKIEFLDVNVCIINNKIETELFTKETDKHLYLHSTSCHPKSVKTAIPYGLGIRAKRICSQNEKYTENRHKIKHHLSKRGYNPHFVDKELRKVDKLNRDDLLKYRQKDQKMDRVPMVLTFSNSLPNVRNVLRKNMSLLHTSDRMKEVFPIQPILAYRRDSNLQDILVHKKHNRMFFQQSMKCEPCNKKCALCPYILNSSTFTNFRGDTFNVKNFINCKSENVVYAIFCLKCDSFVYVGETCDLYQRMLLNFSRYRNEYDDPVAKHFYSDGHTLDDFRVQGLEKLTGDETYRKTQENLWKNKLRTYKPYGINTKE